MKDIRRLKREEIGVSPVIGTILMVAITVVLAASVWMMVNSSAEASMPLSASITGEYEENEDNIWVTFNSLGTPRTADLDEVEFAISHEDGEETIWGDHELISWRLLTADGEVRSSSRVLIDCSEGGLDIDNVESVTIFIDGYDGGRSIDF